MSSANQLQLAASVLALAVIAGCATGIGQPAPPVAAKPAAAATAPAPAAARVMYFAILPVDERYYLFGDAKNYFAYKSHGEVALTRTRIGASPKGTTVVFGITNDDVKQNRPSAAEMIFDGKTTVSGPFHGEVFKDGRYYVFNDYSDMRSFLGSGEVAYGFTDIGVGPGGASLVWVLNANTIKKGRPVDTIATFNALRASK